MTTGTLSVEDYLVKSFPDGDREYLEGHLFERKMGEIDHSDMQSNLAFHFKIHYKGFWVGVAVRMQVKQDRFRVPDVCLIAGGKPTGRIITTPPVLVVEVLSPDDRLSEMQVRIDDYLTFRVPHVWIVDPATRRGYMYLPDGSRHEAKDGVLRADQIQVPLAELFDV